MRFPVIMMIITFDYQTSFRADWISLAVVEVSEPAPGTRTPVESNIVTLSGVTGTAKFARFRKLKNSGRNCTLKSSEIGLMKLFLKTEKSRVRRAGTDQDVATRIARRLKHWRSGWLTQTGSQFAL
jgi:hypothetical protein